MFSEEFLARKTIVCGGVVITRQLKIEQFSSRTLEPGKVKFNLSLFQQQLFFFTFFRSLLEFSLIRVSFFSLSVVVKQVQRQLMICFIFIFLQTDNISDAPSANETRTSLIPVEDRIFFESFNQIQHISFKLLARQARKNLSNVSKSKRYFVILYKGLF